VAEEHRTPDQCEPRVRRPVEEYAGEGEGEDPLPRVEQKGEDPAALPRVRATFVAPMLPDPAFRRSSPGSNAFATSMPNGTDPSR